MTIDTKRLATDAAYWDEVAPEGATHYDPGDNSESCWMMRMGKRVWSFHDAELWTSLDYSEVAHDIDNYIPRPTKPAAPEWGGEGLPPEGADLEYDTHFGNWCPAKCIARGHDHSDPVAVIQTTNRIFIVSDSDRVRIRRTKRQRIGDALAEIIAKEIEIEFIDGNFHIETSSAIDYILSEYNLEPKP